MWALGKDNQFKPWVLCRYFQANISLIELEKKINVHLLPALEEWFLNRKHWPGSPSVEKNACPFPKSPKDSGSY